MQPPGTAAAPEFAIMDPMKRRLCLLCVLCLMAQGSAPAEAATNAGPATPTRWKRNARENQRLAENVT